MTHDHSQASGYSRPRKEYAVPDARPEAFMVENAQWDRIKQRVADLERHGSPEWLVSVGTGAAGIAASCLVAVLVLPASSGTTLGSGVRPALHAAWIAAALLTCVCFALYKWERRRRGEQAEDIRNEMDTIKEAWQERGQ